MSHIMRLSSSSSQPLPLKRSPVASAAVLLACTCLMLVPLVAGVKEPEIDLKTADHDYRQDQAITMDAKYARSTEHSREHHFEYQRKNKSNKSYAKKYVDVLGDGFHQGKEKKSIYDKKYFDYLPAERKGPLETFEADASLMKRTNSRRLRRDTSAVVEQPRTKRQGYTYQVHSYPILPTIIQPSSMIGYNPFYRPMLNNQYLPPPSRPIQIPDRTYLPSNTQRPQPVDGSGTFQVDNRFGNPQFVFDTVYDPSVDTNYILQPGPRPSFFGGQFPNSFQGSRPVATRPTTTARPLPPPTTTRPSSTITTTTPPPGIQNNSDDEFDWDSLGLSPDAVGSRIGGNGGNDNNLNPQRRAAPSKCTWAIANCCSQFSDKIRYHCFEQNQCFGAFWGDNVCRTYYKLALTEIENYYNSL